MVHYANTAIEVEVDPKVLSGSTSCLHYGTSVGDPNTQHGLVEGEDILFQSWQYTIRE